MTRLLPALLCDGVELVGALLSEQNDEWLIQRRYLSVKSMALIRADPTRNTDQALTEAGHLTPV